jgi:predicted acylesterase/phospholipase RssA
VLGLLNDVGLLRNVAVLSTVSGGSIVGMAWIVSLLDGVGFAAFRDRFRAWMLATNVVREALARLTSHDRGERANPSLIRCAAAVYASPDFLGDRRFGEVMHGDGLPAEVIFNATEFRGGVAFRFRRSPNRDAKIGNGSFSVPREVAAQVRLADVVAASSCFPGGFEPILFPDEFGWSADFGLERARAGLGAKFRPALPLMDGGIYDNQGVASVLRANEHGEADTLLISDTNTRQAALYDTPPAPGRGWFTLRMAAWSARILFAMALASVVALGVHAWRERVADGGWQWQDVLVYVVPGLLCLATVMALVFLRRTVRFGQERLRTQVQIAHAWKDLRRLTLPEAFGLVELRVTSLLSLTSNVFMKRVRSLIDAQVFGDERYRQRRAMILLYDLDEPHTKLYHDLPWLRPSARLVERVRSVDQMSTTLWFDSREQLETLERVGAATATFSLLRLIVERHGPECGPPDSPVRPLFDRLRREWDALNALA